MWNFPFTKDVTIKSTYKSATLTSKARADLTCDSQKAYDKIKRKFARKLSVSLGYHKVTTEQRFNSRKHTVVKSFIYYSHLSFKPVMPVDEVITSEENEDSLLNSDSEEHSGDLNNTIKTFGKLIVDPYIQTNTKRNKSIDPDPSESPNRTKPIVDPYIQANMKRNRSLDSDPPESPNPTKKHRPIINMLPSMADVVKTDTQGYMVDIMSAEDKSDLTKDQSDAIQQNVTGVLFAKEDISNIKFETPYFDGNKLRMICKNNETKSWLMETIPKLANPGMVPK